MNYLSVGQRSNSSNIFYVIYKNIAKWLTKYSNTAVPFAGSLPGMLAAELAIYNMTVMSMHYVYMYKPGAQFTKQS